VVRRIDVLTLFPELVEQFFDTALIAQARSAGLLALAAHDLRDWTADRHRTVDDAPYGGGPGMLMKPEPLFAAVEAIQPLAQPRALGRRIDLTQQHRPVPPAPHRARYRGRGSAGGP